MDSDCPLQVKRMLLHASYHGNVKSIVFKSIKICITYIYISNTVTQLCFVHIGTLMKFLCHCVSVSL